MSHPQPSESQPSDLEPAPPPGLSELQDAFGQAMSQPFEFEPNSDQVLLQVDRYSAELVADIRPRIKPPAPVQTGAERLGIYNRQYWYRLFSVMHEEFPLLRHLLGATSLNRLASEYLQRYPSRSPSLNDLPNQLLSFLDESTWGESDQVRECVALERALSEIFIAADGRPLSPKDIVVEEALRFAPHWRLFEENWSLVENWTRAKRDVSDELEIIPEPSRSNWALYRDRAGLQFERLGEIQFALLTRLRDGAPLAEAVGLTAESFTEEDVAFLGENIQSWFQRWASLGWFVAG